MDPLSSQTSQIQTQPLPLTTTTHSTNNHRSTKQINNMPAVLQRNLTLEKKKAQWKHPQPQAAIKEKNNYMTKMVSLLQNHYDLTIQLMVKRCLQLIPDSRSLGDDFHTNQHDEYDDSSRNEEKDEASNYDTTWQQQTRMNYSHFSNDANDATTENLVEKDFAKESNKQRPNLCKATTVQRRKNQLTLANFGTRIQQEKTEKRSNATNAVQRTTL